MIRDNNWYNNNEQRPWPLADLATLVDDNGERLASDVLADMRLAFPVAYGERAYVGSIFLGPLAIGVVIISEDGDTIATFSQARPVEAGRVYRLTGQVTGAAGWIVFGSAVDNDIQVNHRFSTFAQSQLLVRAATSYRSPPVTSIGKLNAAQAMTGLVRLTAGSDITITKETVEIDSVDTEVALFSLRNDQDEDIRNLSVLYAGPCGARPESKNCGDPQPIEAINTISPDCCGVIYIEFRGCADVSSVENDTLGVILDCGFSLADACVTPKHLPDATGKLPNEYPDNCDNDYSPGDDRTPVYGVLEPVVTVTTGTTPSPGGSDPVAFSPNANLPWTESFEDLVAEELTIVSGEFTIVTGYGGGGYARGGAVDILIPDTESAGTTVVFESAHGLSVNDNLIISDSEDSDYDGVHVVTAVPSPNMVVVATSYISDSNGGVWFIANGASSPTAGGSCAGTVNVVIDDGGDAQFSFGQTHLLEVGHVLDVESSPEAAYNASHTVSEILTATDVVTATSYTADAFGGYFVRALTRAAGRIEAATVAGDGSIKLETGVASSLNVGDQIIVFRNTAASVNKLHTITAVDGSLHVVSDAPHSEDGTGGLWILVDGPATSGRNYFTNFRTKSIAVWTGAIPSAADWNCRFIEVETILIVQEGTPPVYRNGGIVFNYQDSANFMLAELSFDSGKHLLLWQVIDGAYNLVGDTEVSAALMDVRYKLTVTIDQYSPLDPSGLIKVQLTGLQDGLSAAIGPGLRVPGYDPSTGTVGLHGHYTNAVFEYLTVRNLER